MEFSIVFSIHWFGFLIVGLTSATTISLISSLHFYSAILYPSIVLRKHIPFPLFSFVLFLKSNMLICLKEQDWVLFYKITIRIDVWNLFIINL
jgi:hypothetical protein